MFKEKLNLALIAGIVICGLMMFSSTSIIKAEGSLPDIKIVGQTADTAVTDITFPAGQTNTIISNPQNNVSGDFAQVLDKTHSKPVVRLHNTSGITLNVWLSITPWTGAVASERYELVTDNTTTVNTVVNGLSTNIDTGKTIDGGAYADLYLEVTLGTASATSGISTITILGE